MPETEYTKTFDLELKTDDLEDGNFEGHCAVFGNVDLQGDKILRNAFVNTIAATKGRWPILMAHRIDTIVGFSTEAREDTKGLWVRGELTLDSTAGRDAYAVMKHAAKAEQKLGLSIGYRIRENGAETEERTGIRLLKDLDVMEFSIASCPANLRARVSRVKAEGVQAADEIEEILREAGFSRNEAKRLMYSMKALREAEPETAISDMESAAAEIRQAELVFQMKGIFSCLNY